MIANAHPQRETTAIGDTADQVLYRAWHDFGNAAYKGWEDTGLADLIETTGGMHNMQK